MSDLHVGMIILGVVIVVAVIAYSSWQERRLKRRTAQMFQGEYDDVLMGDPVRAGDAAPEDGDPVATESPAGGSATEPETGSEPAPEGGPGDPGAAPARPRPGADSAGLDPVIDFVAEIGGERLLPAADVARALSQCMQMATPIRWFGLDAGSASWELVREGHDYDRLAAAVQMASRNGPLSEKDFSLFCDLVQEVAADLLSVVECPDRGEAATRAEVLYDLLCAHDVELGLNVVVRDGGSVPATKVRALVEAAGMKLADDGLFHFRDDEGRALFAMQNFDGDGFTAEGIRSMELKGVSFLLDLPCTADGARVFDKMLRLGQQLVQSLDGKLVDDDGREVSADFAREIRKQVVDLQNGLAAADVLAGSNRAVRLFS